MIKHYVYIYHKSMRGTTARLPPDRIAVVKKYEKTGPLVSCLMVTRGDPALVRTSLHCFQKQTYENKELLIVCDEITEGLRSIVDGLTDVRLVRANNGMSLGLLRNISVEQALGDIVCQWDDDDIYGAHRIERGVAALTQAGADAVFLRQWLIWSPGQRVLKLSRSRLWEGSMLAYKKALPSYADARKREDTMMVESMVEDRILALMDDPLSYCYCIHGKNTFAGSHMQQMIDQAKLSFAYTPALAAFSSALEFSEHSAFQDADRVLAEKETDSKSQMRRIENYLAINQFFRALRHRLTLPKISLPIADS
jgi:glycosyltransferase involved in cell wall biosynthesis